MVIRYSECNSIHQIIQMYTPCLKPCCEKRFSWLHQAPYHKRPEAHTARIILGRLFRLPRYQIKSAIGGHGIAAVLYNGKGPVVMLRAAMYADQVEEAAVLPRESKNCARYRENVRQPAMPATGRDMDVASLLTTAGLMSSAIQEWSGTLILLFQPAKTDGSGAQAMIDDGLYDPLKHAIPVPDVVLGGHLGPTEAGSVALRPGPWLLANHHMKITFFGDDAHTRANSFATRIPDVTAGELKWEESALVFIVAKDFSANSAEVVVTIRTGNDRVRDRIIFLIKLTAWPDACRSKGPAFDTISSMPATVNDKAVSKRLRSSFGNQFGSDNVRSPGGPGHTSDDLSVLATTVHKPYGCWSYRSATPIAQGPRKLGGKLGSPEWASAIESTLKTGTQALATAALTWLWYGRFGEDVNAFGVQQVDEGW